MGKEELFMQLSNFSETQTVRCGFASEVITLQPGLQLGGFLGERKAIGTHDDLKVRSFYLEISNKKRILFVVFDLLEVPFNLSQRIKSKLKEEFDIDEDQVFVAAIHTHSGPDLSKFGKKLEIDVTSGNKSTEEENLLDLLVEKSFAAASTAISNKKTGTLKFGSFLMKEPVCGNRREKKDNEKVEVKLLLFTADSGEEALIYNFGCHPTVLHESNLMYSADFPGAVERNLIESIENLKFVMFINGAAGDISTRFYRKTSSYEEVERIGAILAKEIKENISNLQEVLKKGEDYYSKVIKIKLKFREPMPDGIVKTLQQKALEDLENAKKTGKDNLRIYQSRIEGLKFLQAASNLLKKNREIETILQLAILGELAFVGIPGELFFSLGNMIEKELSPLKVFLVGYSNDYIGYILDEASYTKGEYESYTTFLEKGEGEKIVEKLLELKSKLK